MSAAIGCLATAPAPDRSTTIGLALLMRMAYERVDPTPLWDVLAARVQRDPADAAALMDMATILQLSGQRARGLRVQQDALRLRPLYRRPHGLASGLRVLVLVAAGDFMVNTPLDFLFEGSDAELHLLYVAVDQPLPSMLPDHDLAFLAISESGENQAILAHLQPLLAVWPRPVVNGAPGRIAALSRDGVCAMFARNPHVVSPTTIRAARTALEAVRDGAALEDLLADGRFPILVRPLDSHAGDGLAKLAGPAELAAYLAEHPQAAFYVAPFIDYRSKDGFYRKQRIAFVRGRAFISHMAISEHWMVHYLSAGMAESAAKRDEEGRFFASFDADFARRHRAAFDALQHTIGLDYFGIDCAELADGRLLLFEADVAMIVHALDPEDLYPYKKPAMARLFAGFQAGLQAIAAGNGAACQQSNQFGCFPG